jgi:hypothetical protein
MGLMAVGRRFQDFGCSRMAGEKEKSEKRKEKEKPEMRILGLVDSSTHQECFLRPGF